MGAYCTVNGCLGCLLYSKYLRAVNFSCHSGCILFSSNIFLLYPFPWSLSLIPVPFFMCSFIVLLSNSLFKFTFCVFLSSRSPPVSCSLSFCLFFFRSFLFAPLIFLFLSFSVFIVLFLSRRFSLYFLYLLLNLFFLPAFPCFFLHISLSCIFVFCLCLSICCIYLSILSVYRCA